MGRYFRSRIRTLQRSHMSHAQEDCLRRGHASVLPRIQVEDSIAIEADTSRPLAVPPVSQQDRLEDTLRASSRGSVASFGSAVNTLYSAGNFSTDEEVRVLVDGTASPSHMSSKRERFKQLFRSEKEKAASVVHTDPLDQQWFETTSRVLDESQYLGSTRAVLDLEWDCIVETYLFGDRIEHVFIIGSLSEAEQRNVLMNYLVNSHYEAGQYRFQPPLNTRDMAQVDPDIVLKSLSQCLDQLDDFNEILSLYKLRKDFKSIDDFIGLESFANAPGMTLPMAQSMFGSWLLSFAQDGAIANYKDARIMNQFRKAARRALVVRRLHASGYFASALTSSHFNEYEAIALNRFLEKDNRFALSMALNSIAEYYQYSCGYDTAANYWECNAHITGDIESCDLAIWALRDGFGSGNKVRTRDKWGGGAKRNKYNTKRRIAHLTRILTENGGQVEYGLSWVWKEKYN